ncbi:cytochrome P450 [Ornithinimicrobium avium]|uniref:Cytochrome P450 n=1 Tax=Ornithinimicrobium avium TaxID=2283195 RepID=A0A345NP65_9MICO|nr:cytochrome P450 [Ornithinimicrobium avium]AXH96823.1 cytochrome P450 [Ornithinimicrobium avium]
MTVRRRAVRQEEPSTPRLEREDPGGRTGVSAIWRVRGLPEARQVLRARHATTQAGFTAEKIPRRLKLHPILVSDGPLHDEQRRKVGRFLAPKVVQDRYPGLMQDAADRLLGEAARSGGCRLDDLALDYTVEVTAQVVGLTASSVPRMARRLVTFFNQPPFDITRADLGRTGRQWASAAVNGLVPVVRFWWHDVRPAVRSRRREPRGDIISHLIAEGYSNTDILVECVTYGTAGMVTTREFITMAAWHLLSDELLLERYLAGDEAGRTAILHEIIRLEPVVGHLYRRAQTEVPVGEHASAAPGDLIDVCIRSANADPEAVGPDPLALCPGRPLPTGVNPAGLAFGDGEHRCPGQPLAMLESDVLLHALLSRRPRLVREPELGWDELIEGYTLRGMELSLS